MDGTPEKFAIIGVGCRMPPGGSSLANFWRFLLRGGNALRAIRADRWDWRQFYDEDQRRPGKSYAPKAASLDGDIRQFDPLAFGMSPREAASLDPQQRLLLEVTWESFEDAGIPLERMSGSATGAFVGGFCLDHLVLQAQPSNRHLVNAHSAGGVMMTVLSNRLSHAFNLKGPSLTLDTACSSSLVALHYACQSLRLRECDMALAGGVSVMSRPEFPIIMSKGHFLSPHGECHTFDETAAGYARGEGAGILLLKRLDDAVAAGDQIHAIVRASGVNQDGHTDGIALPNSEAQEALVRRVYGEAGVPFAEVDYIEAHGTGTQAGDTAELAALDRNFAAGRSRKLLVGSVKTNIGHLEAAAGVAGVLKAIGVLKHRQVPRNLHFKRPNPKIPFADYCLEVANETRELPGAAEKPTLYAAVNSFGYGGTNAHILLESAPAPVVPPESKESSPRWIPLSACSAEALRDLAGKFAFSIGKGVPGTLADLAYTTAFRRSHLPVRLSAFVSDFDELRDQLIAASTGQPHAGLVTTGREAAASPPLVFVYTGMGPQWWGMGRELIRDEPIVAAAIDEIDTHFRPLAGWSLKEAMLADEGVSRMARTEVAQPANFALQVALTRLWEAHGIRPSAVVGHSVGEVTAAFVAGVYSLEDAVRVSYYRSQLQQRAAGLGSMLAVGLAEEAAAREIAALPGVSIAAINSFSAVTVSGDTEQLRQLAAGLDARGVFQKFLRVEVAYHSPQMDPLRDDLLAALAGLAPERARLPLFSTAYGKIVPGETWDAEYWWQNMRGSVRFADAARHFLEEGFTAFLEVGPHPVLGNSIKECAAGLERKAAVYPTLRRAEPERPRFLLSLGELYVAGVDPDWSAVAPAAGRFIPGPQYPWQRQTCWNESERSAMERLGLPGPVYLNRTVLGPLPCWEVEINRNYFPFLFDHRVQDQTVFAGMAYIEAALALSREIHGHEAVVLDHVSFERVLIVDYSRIQYLITGYDADTSRFHLSSRTDGEEGSGQRHCRGRMTPQADPHPETLDLEAMRARCSEVIPADVFYERLARRQLHYGPMFRPVTELRRGNGHFLLNVDAGGVVGEEFHPLHPCLFDAALQAVIYCASGEQLFVPFAFEQFQYFSRPDSAECHVVGRIVSQSETQIVADVWLTDAAGLVKAQARHVSLEVIDLADAEAAEDLFYERGWTPAPLGDDQPREGDGERVLVFADAGDSDLSLARELVARMPGSKLITRDAPIAGFATDEMAGWLASSPERDRLVVLWGTGPSDDGGEAVEALNEKVIGLLKAAGASRTELDLTLVTRGAEAVEADDRGANLAATSLGAMGLTAQNEFDQIRCRSVDLDAESGAAEVVAELAADRRGDIAYRDGRRYVSELRLRAERTTAGEVIAVSLEEPVEVVPVVKGRGDSLRFRPVARTEPGPGEIELRVHRAALGDKDLLKIAGRDRAVPGAPTFWGEALGMEASGTVARCGPGSRFAVGDRVAALVPGALRSYATVSDAFAVKLPQGLGFEAAGIPVAYLVAYRGLVEVANLQAGERVLIHHATGGVGQAAHDIARWIGAEIFATAGSEEKRALLRERGIHSVFSSRDADFGLRIREATDHEGIDVVIGAQSASARRAGLALLRTGGRYLETGRKDLVEDLDLPLRAFERNVTFASVDIDRLAAERPELIRRTLAKIFGHIENGDFRPGATRTYPVGELPTALAEMSASRHAGKVLIDFSRGEVEVPRPVSGSLLKADGAYIVTGGTSGFGLMTARWMAARGAGRILLVSRSGGNAPGIGEAIRSIAADGVRIEAHACDVSCPDQVRKLVTMAGDAPFTLRGIVHGAMVLDDAMIAGLGEESFRRVFRPKAIGALNLAAAIGSGAEIDFVAFYSSVSALVGNRGQMSYVAANRFLDGLAHRMRADGLPAVSINWGALAESGVVARDEHLGDVLASAGITGLTDREALDALESILREMPAQVGVFKVDWGRWLEAHPRLGKDPRFERLARKFADGVGSDAASRLRAALEESSPEQRQRALEHELREVLGATLKMAADAVPGDRRINELGVDSLLVLELGLALEERLGIRFSAMEFLKGPTVNQLASMAQSKLWKDGN